MELHRDDRIARLPKWAQDEIEVLDTRLREMALELKRHKDFRTGGATSALVVEPYSEAPQYLDARDTVRFSQPAADAVGARDWVQMRYDYDRQALIVSSNGNDPLVVEPVSSNVFLVRWRA